MRNVGTFGLGCAAGVLALAAVLAGTGRLVLSPPARVATAALPVPDAKHLVPADTPLPPPPNPALLAAPPAEPRPMPMDTKLRETNPSAAPGISLPLQNLKRADIQDTFNDARGGGTKHEATDILAPRGTPVLAVDEGNVVKLFTSKKGGLTVYQFDRSRTYCYYYAHLDRYAEGLQEGMLLRRGDKLGYVGTTGDAPANTPHLHFAILQLGPDQHWWEHTTAIDPYPLLLKALP
jgi:peptidoglycan LD-endopeptidase LytH